MARKVRFPLNMNGTMVRTLEELQEHFHLTSILSYFEDGKLEQWLRDRFNDDKADAIAALDRNDNELGKKICDTLGVEYSADEDVSIEVIENRNNKMTELRKYTDDTEIIKNIDNVAITQDDLYDLLDEGKDKIYLVHGKFEIPTGKKNVTYIGVCEPNVKVNDASVLSNNGIKLENIEMTFNVSSEEYFKLGRMYFKKAIQNYELAAVKGYEAAIEELSIFNPIAENSRNAITGDMISEYPIGKNHIKICMGKECHKKGALKILKKFEEKLGIHCGECTTDGQFSLDILNFNCMGACALAPLILIGEEVYGRIEPDSNDIEEIINRYKD